MSSTQGKVSETEPSSPEPLQQALGLESPQQLSIKQEDSKPETDFTSQPSQAPTIFSISRPETPMSASVEAPDPTQTQPVETLVVSNPYNKPVFTAANPENPTQDELVTYTTNIQNYVMGMRYTLHFLNDPVDTWPLEISLTIHTNIRTAGTIWRAVATFGEYASQWERHVATVRLNTARAETSSARAASAQPTARASRLKTPLPTNTMVKRVTQQAPLLQHVPITRLWNLLHSLMTTNIFGGCYSRWMERQGYGPHDNSLEWRWRRMSITVPQKNYGKWLTFGFSL